MFIVQRDWQLHNKVGKSQQRHREKLKEAIKDKLGDIIAREDLISGDAKRPVRVRIDSLNTYRFRYQNPSEGEGEGTDKGEGGTEPGEWSYDAELTLDELSEMVLEDFELPNLEPKVTKEVTTDEVSWTDIRKKGPWSTFDKKRTIRENIKRNAFKGKPKFENIHQDDLRFKAWEVEKKPDTNACVFLMADRSGSMDSDMIYLIKAFCWWSVRYLRQKYDRVEIRFIAHDTTARECTEKEFFGVEGDGGTMASSAFQLGLEIMDRQYPTNAWNIYSLYFTDCDNWSGDNPAALNLAKQIVLRSNLFGFGKVKGSGYSDFPKQMENAFEGEIKFTTFKLDEKGDVLLALRELFTREPE